MGREPRRFEEGHAYHLTMHGVDDKPIAVDDIDRQDFVIRLGRSSRTHLWSLHAWCLRETHYHLLVTPGDIPAGMRQLNGGYSRAFNVRHGRRGPLFDGRYRVREIRDEQHMLAAIRYIEWNAVKDGVVGDFDDWPWRSRTSV